MSALQKEALPFYDLVSAMEEAIGFVEDVFDLIALIDKKGYLELRGKIIDVFQVGELSAFDDRAFGEEVEFGDISDAIRLTTFGRYPQETPMDKPISLEERKEWCNSILTNMDAAATYGS